MKDYGTRQRQSHRAGRHKLAGTLKGIQKDERRHKSLIGRALGKR